MNQGQLIRQLLVVGPLPPPIGGGTINVQILLDELSKYQDIRTATINISPSKWVKDSRLVSIEKLIRSISIVTSYLKSIKKADAAILIATHSFIFTTGLILLAIAKYYKVPFYIKPLGAEIKEKFNSQRTYLQRCMLAILRWASGVMFQTKQLQRSFYQLGVGNAFYIPGYRTPSATKNFMQHTPSLFRIVFISQIIHEKGPFLLLKALQSLSKQKDLKIECDFFGPIINEKKKEFFNILEQTPGASYCGIAESRRVSFILSQYDAFVFPTLCVSEGHPGVIIEAMHAGIPIISSRFESATELITNKYNGLLVPIGDSRALSSAILQLATNWPLRLKMAEANKQIKINYQSDTVVSKMVDLMFQSPKKIYHGSCYSK